jgi:hypothetical protein
MPDTERILTDEDFRAAATTIVNEANNNVDDSAMYNRNRFEGDISML